MPQRSNSDDSARPGLPDTPLRSVERRRACRLKLLFHLYSLGRPQEPIAHSMAYLGQILQMAENDVMHALRHMAALGYLRMDDWGSDCRVWLTERGRTAVLQAERNPDGTAAGLADLLDSGMVESTLGSLDVTMSREEMAVVALHWLYLLADGSHDAWRRVLDLTTLIDLSGEALVGFLIELQMSELVEFDPTADKVRLTIEGVVLIETVLWRGTSSTAGLPTAVELGLLETEEIPSERR